MAYAETTKVPVEQLLPCPFCGGDADDNNAVQEGKVNLLKFHGPMGRYYAVYCNCGAKGSPGVDTPEAIERWNTRASLRTAETDEALVEQVAYAIIAGSAGERAAQHAREFDTANWADAKRSARAALSIIEPAIRAKVLEEVEQKLEQTRTYYLGENPGHRFPIPSEIRREFRTAIRSLKGEQSS